MRTAARTRSRDWHEPTDALPLRWGRHSPRTYAGGALIVLSGLVIVQTTAYTVTLGTLGAMVHVLGWAILPARGALRTICAPASLVAFVVMLAGPSLAWIASVPLALWLVVRERPLITAVLVPMPALASVVSLVVLGPFAPRLLLFSIVFATAVGCAVGARSIALREPAKKSR